MTERSYLCLCGDHQADHVERNGGLAECVNLDCECEEFMPADPAGCRFPRPMTEEPAREPITAPAPTSAAQRGEIVKPEPCHKHGPGLAGTRCPCTLPCPECDAAPGARCKRPSEHEAMGMHRRRMEAAEFVDSLCGHPYTVDDYTSRGLHVPPFAIGPRKAETVKRVDLWGTVTDTYQTEAEANGFRASQGALL